MSDKTIVMKIDKAGHLLIRRGPNLKYAECITKHQYARYPELCNDSCARFREDEDYTQSPYIEKTIECCGTIHSCCWKNFEDERVKEDK